MKFISFFFENYLNVNENLIKVSSILKTILHKNTLRYLGEKKMISIATIFQTKPNFSTIHQQLRTLENTKNEEKKDRLILILDNLEKMEITSGKPLMAETKNHLAQASNLVSYEVFFCCLQERVAEISGANVEMLIEYNNQLISFQKTEEKEMNELLNNFSRLAPEHRAVNINSFLKVIEDSVSNKVINNQSKYFDNLIKNIHIQSKDLLIRVIDRRLRKSEKKEITLRAPLEALYRDFLRNNNVTTIYPPVTSSNKSCRKGRGTPIFNGMIEINHLYTVSERK